MIKTKKSKIRFFFALTATALCCLTISTKAEEAISSEEKSNKIAFSVFKDEKERELNKKQEDAVDELKNRQKKELDDLKKEEKTKKEEEKKEKPAVSRIDELKDRQEKELNELAERQKQEKEQLEQERIKERLILEKAKEVRSENSAKAKVEIKEYKKEVRKAKRAKSVVEVITNENDPLYIQFAEVKGGKTKFLKVKGVELSYKIKLKNQTPKIVTSALIGWERSVSFNESQTISKEAKIAKPIAPYSTRIVQFNETNSKRDGETYKVKVEKVIFKDGTQWKNPS